MPFLVKMRAQPGSYIKPLSRYEILPFWDHFALFGVQKRDFYKVTETRFFFGNKQYPNDVKETYLTFIAIFSRSKAIFSGLEIYLWDLEQGNFARLI